MTATFTPGSLVHARGREWVVLPDSTDEMLLVRPLGGLDDEVTGILKGVESITETTFGLPNPKRPGSHHACRLLRDAARLSTRAAAGPFRCFGRIAVEPRPYQLVPLLMAMRLDTVRLLIADDVGIGKTVEACLVARELLDRGEITRMAVLCPPHLAEQWQREMLEKFHIEAELVLSSTVHRLERQVRGPAESIFERFPITIVSTDFIKSPRRRDDFLRACPEFIIVDEAHTCTIADQAGKARQARHDLVEQLAQDKDRHLVLVTATPHSGNEHAFRSLLALLDGQFANLPMETEADERSAIRRKLANHLVQRRRGDVLEMDRLLGTETSFPDRKDAEESYKLSAPYKAFFAKVLRFAHELVTDQSGGKRKQRVRWWSALALLRALASSPVAAAATLRNRAATADTESVQQADEVGRQAVMDQDDSDSVEAMDFTPGGDTSEDQGDSPVKRRLRDLAKEADKLIGGEDAKLQTAIKHVKQLIKDGYNPIIFCRFIDTAEYVAGQLRKKLNGVEVQAVTGLLPPKEREDRIAQLGEHAKRLLVCTDCLSEGVNLQDHFDAVVHYDLSWNPTRHEQREGRVDRFGQPKAVIRVLTYFGVDNQIDGVVLDVLLRKHKQIRSDLGISVAVPANSEHVIEALFEGMRLRDSERDQTQLMFPQFEMQREDLHAKWEDAKEREKVSRSRFAQHSIKTEEVAGELQAIRDAIGAGPTVEQFMKQVFHLIPVPFSEKSGRRIDVRLSMETPRALRDALSRDDPFKGRFDLPVEVDEIYLSRTHPLAEGLASFVMETAIDETQAEGEKLVASRCGVMRTNSVPEKTSMLLVRFRYHLLVKRRGGDNRPLLAEEIRTLAFTGTPESPAWLDEEATNGLLDAQPTGNLPPTLVTQQLEMLIQKLPTFEPQLDGIAATRAQLLLDAHTRVRQSAKVTGKVSVEPVLPVDVLGAYILLPQS